MMMFAHASPASSTTAFVSSSLHRLKRTKFITMSSSSLLPFDERQGGIFSLWNSQTISRQHRLLSFSTKTLRKWSRDEKQNQNNQKQNHDSNNNDKINNNNDPFG
jgi:hypothetical protein